MVVDHPSARGVVLGHRQPTAQGIVDRLDPPHGPVEANGQGRNRPGVEPPRGVLVPSTNLFGVIFARNCRLPPRKAVPTPRLHHLTRYIVAWILAFIRGNPYPLVTMRISFPII